MFIKIRPEEAESFHAVGRTDNDAASSCFSQFCEGVKNTNLFLHITHYGFRKEKV